jgi:hypothetical protein
MTSDSGQQLDPGRYGTRFFDRLGTTPEGMALPTNVLAEHWTAMTWQFTSAGRERCDA